MVPSQNAPDADADDEVIARSASPAPATMPTRAAHRTGGVEPVILPGTQPVSFYSCVCIAFPVVFCFVHRPRAKRDPLFGWRGGLRTAKSEGVERRRRAHRLTTDGHWDGRLRGASRSAATRSDRTVKNRACPWKSMRSDVADVTAGPGGSDAVALGQM